MEKKEKVIWITGASSGIGKSTALQFVKGGKPVAASSRTVDKLEKIKNDLTEKGNLFEVFPVNVTSSDDVIKAEKAISQNYDISCLINGAGVTSFEKAADNSIKNIEEIINTNLLGAIYTIKSVLPGMIQRNGGTIINILSVVTKKIFTESSAYSASKAGLLAYVKVLREEVRPNNIKVINIIPGATRTPIWPNSALEKYSSRMMSPDDIGKLIYELSLLNTNLVPEEVVIRPMKGDL